MPFYIVAPTIVRPTRRYGYAILWPPMASYPNRDAAEKAAEQNRAREQPYAIVEAPNPRSAVEEALRTRPDWWPAPHENGSRSGIKEALLDILDVAALVAREVFGALFDRQNPQRRLQRIEEQRFRIGQAVSEHRISHDDGRLRPKTCRRCAELLARRTRLYRSESM